MTSVSTSNTAWEEDPDGASILLATGRARHDLLVVAEPALLEDLELDWGQPQASLPLSFLPGVSAPGNSTQADELRSYDRDGVGVLVACGRTSLFEGKPNNRVTALARIAAGAGVRAALLVTRAAALNEAPLGSFLPVADHLNFSGLPLFNANTLVESHWDEALAQQLSTLPGVLEPAVVALVPGPVKPTRAEAAWIAGSWAEAIVTDTVAEAAALSCRGVRVGALALVDAHAGESGKRVAGRRSGRRAVSTTTQTDGIPQLQPPAKVVADAVEMLVKSVQ